MIPIAFCLLLVFLAGIIAVIFFKNPRISSFLGCLGLTVSSIAGLICSLDAFLKGSVKTISFPWSVIGDTFSLRIDPLSLFFLIVLFSVSMAIGIYARSYINHSCHGGKGVSYFWFLFNTLISSIGLVVVAGNAIVFLMAWEIMSISSYFLVTFHDEDDEVNRAGIIYIITMQIGVVCLLILFAFLGAVSGSFEFSVIEKCTGNFKEMASFLFIVALIGFGTKAGVVPLHVWLPEAHPAAPTPVSALMSAVMIKTGIYGLLRVLMFLGAPPLWWGILLIVVGIVSGIFGILLALVQNDIKKILAYSSIENIGIIILGIGIGMVGISQGIPLLIVMGFAGGILHVLNHSLFKSLLFLGAGVVVENSGSRDINLMGGFLKRIPFSGITFLIGSIAICALPPLNGFIGEFLIYLGGFDLLLSSPKNIALAVVVIVSLGIIGVLASACFAKVFGIVFLGNKRAVDNDEKIKFPENGFLVGSLIFLTLMCMSISLFCPFVIGCLSGIVNCVSGMPILDIDYNFSNLKLYLLGVVYSILLFVGVLAVLLLIRAGILKYRKVEQSVTWDCAYVAPCYRMQYTGSSFVQIINDFLILILGKKSKKLEPKGFFPNKLSVDVDSTDIFWVRLYKPAYKFLCFITLKLRIIQQGHVHVYVLYIVMTLLLLLLFKLR